MRDCWVAMFHQGGVEHRRGWKIAQKELFIASFGTPRVELRARVQVTIGLRAGFRVRLGLGIGLVGKSSRARVGLAVRRDCTNSTFQLGLGLQLGLAWRVGPRVLITGFNVTGFEHCVGQCSRVCTTQEWNCIAIWTLGYVGVRVTVRSGLGYVSDANVCCDVH